MQHCLGFANESRLDHPATKSKNITRPPAVSDTMKISKAAQVHWRQGPGSRYSLGLATTIPHPTHEF